MKVSREVLREAGRIQGKHVIMHVRGVSIYLGKKAQHGKINKRGLFAVFAPKVYY